MNAEKLPAHRADDRSEAMQKLRTDLNQLRLGLRYNNAKHVVSTGILALDDILPNRGLIRGTLSEWISAMPGSGATSLAMRIAASAQQDGPLVIVDRQRSLYAPAIPETGVDMRDVILVRPKTRSDELWAIEQALRCPGIGVVLCRIEQLKDLEFRRLQLAAESASAIGLLIRPAKARHQLNWADLRFQVSPRPSLPRSFCRRLEVECVYVKGGAAGRTIQLDVCDETGSVCLAPEFSNSASPLPAARA